MYIFYNDIGGKRSDGDPSGRVCKCQRQRTLATQESQVRSRCLPTKCQKLHNIIFDINVFFLGDIT